MANAVWNGLHLADLVFPAFVFCMGVSIAVLNRRDAQRLEKPLEDAERPRDSFPMQVMGSQVNPLQTTPTALNDELYVQLREPSNRPRIVVLMLEYAMVFWRLLRRSLTLFALGFALSNVGFDDYREARIFGVLQRVAFIYFLTGIISMFALPRYSPRQVSQQNAHKKRFLFTRIVQRAYFLLRDVLPFWPEWIAVLALLGVQLGFEFGVNVPDCPRGYLGPGGLHWNASFVNCTGGAHRWIDVYVLGESHLNTDPTTVDVYKTEVNFDQEGLLGTCSATFLCFLGLQAGKVLLFSSNSVERVVRLCVWAVICGVLTLPLVLVKGPLDFNPSLIPINKNLWYVDLVKSFTTSSLS